LYVPAHFTPHGGARSKKWVVGRRRSIIVQAQHDTGEMRIVWSGTAELIILDRWSGTHGRRTAGQILHPTATAVVADDDVKLTVRTELHDAAVVISAQCLPGVGLKRMQSNEIAV